MTTPREQYDSMLDELSLPCLCFRGNSCGCNDFQPTCDECGWEFWADDPDEEAICSDCKEAAAEDEVEVEVDVERRGEEEA